MKRSLPVYLFLLLTAVYVLLVMLLPTDPATLARYHITQGQARLLNLTVVLPLAAIWYLALNGFVRFWQYSKIIRNTNEGWSFTMLAYGLMILAFSLPLNAIVSAIFNYVSIHNTNFLPTATILRNYITLVLAIISFGLLARGAVLLVISHKEKIRYKPVMPLFMAPVMIILTSVFTWLVVANQHELSNGQNSYYLPNWLVILTIVIPYLAAWVAGILSIYYIYIYHQKVKGAVYKQAFSELAKGLAMVTFISVFVQLLVTITEQINRLKLTPILLLIYLLVILYAVGFWFIAHGAKKLQTFEEV
jgi:hypothetical protein